MVTFIRNAQNVTEATEREIDGSLQMTGSVNGFNTTGDFVDDKDGIKEFGSLFKNFLIMSKNLSNPN